MQPKYLVNFDYLQLYFLGNFILPRVPKTNFLLIQRAARDVMWAKLVGKGKILNLRKNGCPQGYCLLR